MQKKYFKNCFNDKVDKDMMLVRMSSGKDRFIALVWLILKSGISRNKIYVFGEDQSGKKIRILKKRLGVRYLRERDERFYEVLAKAKYIYFDEQLDDFFIKKRSQILYLFNSQKDSHMEQYDNMLLKADMSEQNVLKDTLRFTKMIRGGFKPESAQKKKRTLILVNKAYVPRIESFLQYLFDVIDYSKNELVLFVENMDSEGDPDRFDFVDPRVIIVSKNGKMHWTRKRREINEHYQRIANGLEDEGDVLTEDEKLGARKMYSFEKDRVFGNRGFDTVINFGFATNYWLSLIYSIPCKSLYMLVDQAKPQKNERIKAMLGDVDTKETYFTLANIKSKLKYVDVDVVYTAFIPNIHKKHILQCKEAELDGEKVFITNFSPGYFTGTYVLNAMPCFGEGEFSYLIVDNSLEKNQWSDFINRLDIEKLHIYDLFNVLKGNYIKYPVFNSQPLLYSFIDRYGSCVYCTASNLSIVDEAREFKKKIEPYDKDANPVKEVPVGTGSDYGDVESILFRCAQSNIS